MESPFSFFECIGTLNRRASSPNLRAPSPPLRAEERDGERRCRSGSWKASFGFFACIGTMNPPLTPPGGELTACGRTPAPLLGGVGGGSVQGKPPYAFAQA